MFFIGESQPCSADKSGGLPSVQSCLPEEEPGVCHFSKGSPEQFGFCIELFGKCICDPVCEELFKKGLLLFDFGFPVICRWA